ncbi:acetyl-CoA acyltransferase [Cryptococcus neoformans]|uniref:Acetyl-CoA acyltransferase n=2 Tax=Cryptococcus neoformans TaxID=5207 RepID=A0A854QHF7_CRYNE|nr:acetyl-CoA acyltransferase [Cryptococcus neoformans var. grubii H99]AUB22071.1 acetyl-CoA acyltransferase [Cryptococcus neoformans var. grubii]OWZ36409.1 acetyl-CoA acyltransferase [Cryptococcus neoformans var. grubii AD2-60a]OWZ48076.1 acetyl-CoA acyltransferase [Cryptococcus neoformans var. grubii C23]OWZ57049.1 acetyl-CoA acyltransferase [Cryptococcus neoformans var. grubii AD1-83a]OWZ58340.1 acetyl-CoA acyltransferase [Cryptococcus neoformans var. grubii 125.91]OWZ80671.1 acetyl-CoA ac|eukprot:XP_012046754.1 acetyl-CoA acyltransferase [Cryptococcus neoformans var. grubii H99]
MSSAIQNITNSIPSLGRARLLINSSDDVVIVSAVRTPIAKAKKGGFKDCCPEDLLAAVFTEAVKRGKVNPAQIQDVAVGNVLPPGGGANVARMAQLYAGIPYTTPINTVNRQCSSGLTAVVQIANEIKAGEIDIGIGAGVEHMTAHYGAGVLPEKMSEEILSNPESADCLTPMGITSENVAKQYNISRDVQDTFAANSFGKAAAAQKAGKFKEEIVPVKVRWTDPKTNEEKEIIVDSDEGIREGVTAESLAKLKPAFAKDGSTHAGNASQVSDGAAAVILARRSVAQKLGLPILGKFVVSAVVGVPPKLMGIGPAFAIPKVLEKAGISKDDVDFFEINEAFASQAVMSIQHLHIPFENVNPVGGAIAIGHPLGCTGARQIATAFSEAKREKKKVFVTSMCIGSGMGMAAVFVNEQ